MKITWIGVRLTIVVCYLYSTFYWQHFKLSLYFCPLQEVAMHFSIDYTSIPSLDQ